ncbi:MAG: SUMF1/EgtB/PvdO family nonheme iron enzyme [Anaerolineae bacterium]|nr:SUMF1/EgtB/PvdO family nonheme iron enzyme [Anaerolineae bacterium]MDH7473006.1 SUMF1/EgtB/PvdO family nonheme iron enzyme [Anaerolineae bacterium]
MPDCGAGSKRARVLRGGSWNNNERNARCACRNHNDPDNFNNNIGFRVVAAHDSCRWDDKAVGSRTTAGAQPGREPARSGPGCGLSAHAEGLARAQPNTQESRPLW